MVLSVDVVENLDNLPGFPEEFRFRLGTYLLQSGSVVADVSERNSIPMTDRVSGMTVKSEASGIVWVLYSDLVTWAPIDNQNPNIYTDDPALGFPFHKIYVETPGNGGDDVNGEGTVAAPFATVAAACRATISKGTKAGINIEVGPGVFNESGLHAPTDNIVTIKGSINILATIPLGSQTPVGLLAGKYAQFSTDIGAYGFSVTEGDTFAKIEFAGFEDFPNYYPVLGSSASPNIDLVNSSAPFGDLIVFEQLTTINATASIGVGGLAIQLEAVKLRDSDGFLSMSAEQVHLKCCDISNFAGSSFIVGTFGSIRSCYIDIGGIEAKKLGSMQYCLIESCDMAVVETELTSAISVTVTRENGLAFSIGAPIGSIGHGTAKVFVGLIDLEDGSGFLVNGKGCWLTLQQNISVGTGVSDPVTRALHVINGGTYERAGSGVWTGATAGVPVIVDTQGIVTSMAASFGGLTNSSVGGDEITVGGNAPATFAGGPYTDFVLGNTSRGAIAR